MRSSANRFLVVGLILGVSVFLMTPPPASGGSPSITLWTDGATGWSNTDTSFTNPGPAITVGLGDNVTLILNGTDGSNHQWFIDYDNDSRRDANEPQSPQFRSVAIRWNFTANVNGTYNYRDRPNPTLAGEITILTSSPGGLDNNLVLAVGAIIAFVAVIALLWFMMQRKDRGKEPRKEQEK